MTVTLSQDDFLQVLAKHVAEGLGMKHSKQSPLDVKLRVYGEPPTLHEVIISECKTATVKTESNGEKC